MPAVYGEGPAADAQASGSVVSANREAEGSLGRP